MNRTLILYLSFFYLPLVGFAQNVIIPSPKDLKQGSGSILFVQGGPWVSEHSNLLEWMPKASHKKGTPIHFSIVKNVVEPEYYALQIKKEGVFLEGTQLGLQWAWQTLRQLIDLSPKGKDKTIVLPYVSIRDFPGFQWRGMHLDVSRHAFPVDSILKFIDRMAYYKFNRFHWHLTDDQGWRIEIKQFPTLNKLASQRKETQIAKNFTPFKGDGKVYSFLYTQEEVKRVVKYAEMRGITVVPEIEMPGHNRALLAAFPKLGCTGGPYETATSWGVFEDILCAGNSETMPFLYQVMDEILALFPSHWIHVGGDEAPKDRWKQCPKCQSLKNKLNLPDENALQSHLISRMDTFLSHRGRALIGWDEILEGGLSTGATVMSWRGSQGALHAADLGHDAILTPTDFCYFDYYQSKQKEQEPLAIGGYLPLEKVYNWVPIPDSIPNEKRKHFLGVQANIWTEYMPTWSQVEYMAFPRMLAMSEVAWAAEKNYADFLKKAKIHQRTLVNKGIHARPIE